MTTITVSYSEIDSFRQCPHKHELAYKERWVSPDTSPALRRGTLWHAVLEEHYRCIQAAQILDTLDADDQTRLRLHIIRKFLADEVGRQTEDQELIHWMYEGYLDYYGLDPEWRIVAVEHDPVIWLPTDRGGRSRFKLKLKIDLVIQNPRGEIWIVDHKSGRDLPKDKELDIDDQFGLYTWALRKIGRDVMGSVHNGARTQRNKDQTAHFQPLFERFARKHLYRSPEELRTIAVEAYKAARRAYAIPIGTADRAPNPDTCRWRCDYTEACLFGRRGGDERGMLSDQGYVTDHTRH